MRQSHYTGLHLIANLHQVANVPELNTPTLCRERCLAAVLAAGLTVVGDFFYGFEANVGIASAGVTGAVVLAESHVTLHTWPESAYVTLDVFVCNYQSDNSAKARQLFEALIDVFEPAEVKRVELVRD